MHLPTQHGAGGGLPAHVDVLFLHSRMPGAWEGGFLSIPLTAVSSVKQAFVPKQTPLHHSAGCFPSIPYHNQGLVDTPRPHHVKGGRGGGVSLEKKKGWWGDTNFPRQCPVPSPAGPTGDHLKKSSGATWCDPAQRGLDRGRASSPRRCGEEHLVSWGC